MSARRGIAGLTALGVCLLVLVSDCAGAIRLRSASVVTAGASSRVARQHPNSGVIGRVLIGPACPVAGAGQSCFHPYAATIVIRSASSGKLLDRVHASDNGRFRIALSAGRYRLTPQDGWPYPRAAPQTVSVRSGRYTSVVIYYSSGLHPGAGT